MQTSQFFKQSLIPAAQMTMLWSHAVAQHQKCGLDVLRTPHRIPDFHKRKYELTQFGLKLWNTLHLCAVYTVRPAFSKLPADAQQRMAKALEDARYGLQSLLSFCTVHAPNGLTLLLNRQLTPNVARKQTQFRNVGPSQAAWMQVNLALDTLLTQMGYRPGDHEEWVARLGNKTHPLQKDGRIGHWLTLARNSDWALVVAQFGVMTKPGDAYKPMHAYGSYEGRLRARDLWAQAFGKEALFLWDDLGTSGVSNTAQAPLGESPASAAPAKTSTEGPPSNKALPEGVRVETGPHGLLLVRALVTPLDELPAELKKGVKAEGLPKMPLALRKQLDTQTASFEVTWPELAQGVAQATAWQSQVRQGMPTLVSAVQSFLDEQRYSAVRKKLSQHFSKEELKIVGELMSGRT